MVEEKKIAFVIHPLMYTEVALGTVTTMLLLYPYIW
jgi:hypothetical protein